MASTDPSVSLSSEQSSHPMKGILFLLLATTLFPVQDVIIKSLSGGFAVHQIVFWRGVFALPIVAGFVWLEGGIREFRLGSFWLQLARAGTGFSSYLVYYMALAAIGLAETAAITFSTPIFVTIFAMLFLGERIGAFRWLAVVLGLIGVVIIVQPGAGVFEPAAVLALLAAVFYAISIILTRKIGHRSNGGSMTVFTVFFFILAGGTLGSVFSNLEAASPHPSLDFLYRGWVMPAPRDWLLLLVLGGISGIGFFSLSQAYRLAEASVVTPFEYTYLPWAILWGWVFFGSLPGATTWVGLVLIVGAGLLIVFREAVLGRRVVRRKGLGILRQR
ncbi:MAG: EamA family transporter [Rhodobacteraceae bacterium]|nr:EamA family transporter [Paracoccaceae bacterium]